LVVSQVHFDDILVVSQVPFDDFKVNKRSLFSF